MTKTVAFFTVAGMATIPETRRLQHPGQEVWPSWNSFGRKSVILSMDNAGFFQDLLQHVCINTTCMYTVNSIMTPLMQSNLKRRRSDKGPCNVTLDHNGFTDLN